MSLTLARSPLEPIVMNGAGSSKRRGARFSMEGVEESEPPAKKSRVDGAQTATVATKEQDGDAGAVSKRKRKVYEEDRDGFSFSKSRKAKASKAPSIRDSTAERASPTKAPSLPSQLEAVPATTEEPAPKTTGRKVRRKLPTTPEREAAAKPPRRSKRLSGDNVEEQRGSPHKPAHAQSHANHERSPSPFRAKPLTIEKKRRRGEDGVEEEKITRIQLPFADTPVIKRNREMRKGSAENGQRRSSSGMRGRRASSLIDEGRGNGEWTARASHPKTPTGNPSSSSLYAKTWPTSRSAQTRRPSALVPDVFASMLQDEDDMKNLPAMHPAMESVDRIHADNAVPNTALPHSEVPTAEFFKHISANLTEPRRMRCLLGWCGLRALPPKPEAPKDASASSNLQFQAMQAARVVQEELSQDLITKGVLSDWFSRDESVPPQTPLRMKANPRNVANTIKAEELERELERLKKERAEWDVLAASTARLASPAKEDAEIPGHLSPLRPDLLDSPQRAILEQLQTASTGSSTEPAAIEQRLGSLSANLEFTVDQFAHGVHALAAVRDTAERLAERVLDDAARVLEERERERKANGKAVDAMDALRGLAKVLNAKER
ncbi:Mis12-Mtw1 protein family-domain-containing protein [Neohortaea acidophila]|uniref:Mis12-Mtw1 protein family-domain-containing protein n=1 Tax=Neohortaea acidophila TaxID=245834 RepID=A0A6A6PWE6_9PEZI|nr:Mis12-Mtw1 protein family-domain-containing protein [Neohortaea acidophila]KAF2484054.1 Mis12-Mtw1 protein family-domain-containing protein [Neohortaea acidophila]